MPLEHQELALASTEVSGNWMPTNAYHPQCQQYGSCLESLFPPLLACELMAQWVQLMSEAQVLCLGSGCSLASTMGAWEYLQTWKSF